MISANSTTAGSAATERSTMDGPADSPASAPSRTPDAATRAAESLMALRCTDAWEPASGPSRRTAARADAAGLRPVAHGTSANAASRGALAHHKAARVAHLATLCVRAAPAPGQMAASRGPAPRMSPSLLRGWFEAMGRRVLVSDADTLRVFCAGPACATAEEEAAMLFVASRNRDTSGAQRRAGYLLDSRSLAEAVHMVRFFSLLDGAARCSVERAIAALLVARGACNPP